MTEITLILSALSLVLLGLVTVLLVKLSRSAKNSGDKAQLSLQLARLQEQNQSLQEQSQATQSRLTELKGNLEALSGVLGVAQDRLTAANEKAIGQMSEALGHRVRTMEKQVELLSQNVEQRLQQMSQANEQKLGQIQNTVDEKLQKSLDERISRSFSEVSARLEQVYKSLGEMQTLTREVGDLSRALTNVKTRGILGEIQLGAILEEILSPEQYETNVVTVEGSHDPVEFAVKLPGEGRPVYLPIDSKFPLDCYRQLEDAYEAGDAAAVQEAGKLLDTRLKLFAKDIRNKYVHVPETTDFAIMFLPIEGLYAQAVRRGMVEILQAEYKVNIAGPTTMAALLNSLQMGFRTLAIQKRTGEVWQVLGAVKTEFDKFASTLSKAQSRIDQAHKELDDLVGVRTRKILRKLQSVEALDEERTQLLLDPEDNDG